MLACHGHKRDLLILRIIEEISMQKYGNRATEFIPTGTGTNTLGGVLTVGMDWRALHIETNE